MIKIISKKEFNRLKEIEVRCEKYETEIYLNNKRRRMMINFRCLASDCIDNKEGRCTLGHIVVKYNGMCEDYDTGSLIKEMKNPKLADQLVLSEDD